MRNTIVQISFPFFPHFFYFLFLRLPNLSHLFSPATKHYATFVQTFPPFWPEFKRTRLSRMGFSGREREKNQISLSSYVLSSFHSRSISSSFLPPHVTSLLSHALSRHTPNASNDCATTDSFSKFRRIVNPTSTPYKTLSTFYPASRLDTELRQNDSLCCVMQGSISRNSSLLLITSFCAALCKRRSCFSFRAFERESERSDELTLPI